MIVVHILSFFLLVFLLFFIKKQIDEKFSAWYYLSFLFKLGGAISLGLVYIYYYTSVQGDTFSFFEKAKLLYASHHSFGKILFSDDLPAEYSHWFGHARDVFFLKLIYLYGLLFGMSYWCIAVAMAITSFMAIWFFVIRLSSNHERLVIPAIIAFSFVPSVVFWCSGLMKETVAFSCIMILSAVAISGSGEQKMLLHVVVMMISAWLLYQIKYYAAVVWLPFILFTWLTKNFDIAGWKPVYKVTVFSIVSLIVVFFISNVHVNVNPGYVMHAVVENHDALLAKSADHNTVQFSGLEPTLVSFIGHMPKGVFYGFFGPFLQFQNLLQGVASIENLVLFGLLLFSFRFTRFSSILKMETAFILVILLSLSFFIGLSTPNLGTLVRYSMVYKPFLWFLVLSVFLSHPSCLSRLIRKT